MKKKLLIVLSSLVCLCFFWSCRKIQHDPTLIAVLNEKGIEKETQIKIIEKVNQDLQELPFDNQEYVKKFLANQSNYFNNIMAPFAIDGKIDDPLANDLLNAYSTTYPGDSKGVLMLASDIYHTIDSLVSVKVSGQQVFPHLDSFRVYMAYTYLDNTILTPAVKSQLINEFKKLYPKKYQAALSLYSTDDGVIDALYKNKKSMLVKLAYQQNGDINFIKNNHYIYPGTTIAIGSVLDLAGICPPICPK